MHKGRRNALALLAAGTSGILLPVPAKAREVKKSKQFRYCLNTSTISGQNLGIKKYVEIASKAGYIGIEVWVRDVKAYLDAGNSASSLKKYIQDHKLKVENAIGFAPWISGGAKGMQQMQDEMEMIGSIGGERIAAPPAGVSGDQPLDFFMAGEKYGDVLELGRKTGVMPQLEFWGASKAMWHLGQVLMVAGVANDPDVRLLPDVYHLFRGDSGFDGLKMLDGKIVEIFHMNDYPGSKPRTEQVDADRVFPGDGVAPLTQILTDLKNMGGQKVLSLELFNREYWKQDPLEIAKKGLAKMKDAVSKIQ